MIRYLYLTLLASIFFSSCKEKEPKYCCVNYSVDINLTLIDSTKSMPFDTNYIKSHNNLNIFSTFPVFYSDSLIQLSLYANTDYTENDKDINTIKYFYISPNDVDTIVTTINGTCGRHISKLWYNGVLIDSLQNKFIRVVK